MKYIAQIVLHHRPLRQRTEEADALQLAFEILEKRQDHLARRGGRAFRRPERRRAAMRRLHPFIADEKHGLGEIERGIGWIDRKADDLVGQRDFFIVEAGALGTEENAELFAGRGAPRRLGHCGVGRQHRLQLAALPRRRCVNAIEVGNRLFEAGKELRCFEQMHSARGGGIGALAQCAGAWPSLARIDEAQIAQAEIRHRARAHADVHGKLRPHQNHGGAAGEARNGMICASASHRPTSEVSSERRNFRSRNRRKVHVCTAFRPRMPVL